MVVFRVWRMRRPPCSRFMLRTYQSESARRLTFALSVNKQGYEARLATRMIDYDELCTHTNRRPAVGDRFPSEKTDEFEAWLTARDHLELVRKNAREDAIIVYASGESVFIHAVAVGEEAVDPPLIDDLLRWGGNPFQASTVSYVYGSDPEDIRLEATPPIDGSDSLANAKPLILGRTRYDQPTGGTDYFEVVQEYSVLTDIHCYREHGAYCRYDHRGDLLPVVTISSPTSSINTLVSFSRDELDEYLAVSGQLIVRMFDFSMLRRAAFHGWPDREEVHKAGDLFYRQAISPGTAGSARGVQIIRPRRARSAILRRMRSKVFGKKREL